MDINEKREMDIQYPTMFSEIRWLQWTIHELSELPERSPPEPVLWEQAGYDSLSTAENSAMPTH